MCPTRNLRSFGTIILFVSRGNSVYQKCKHLEKYSTEDMGIRRHQLFGIPPIKKKETSQNVTTIEELIAALGDHKTFKQSDTLQNYI